MSSSGSIEPGDHRQPFVNRNKIHLRLCLVEKQFLLNLPAGADLIRPVLSACIYVIFIDGGLVMGNGNAFRRGHLKVNY